MKEKIGTDKGLTTHRKSHFRQFFFKLEEQYKEVVVKRKSTYFLSLSLFNKWLTINPSINLPLPVQKIVLNVQINGLHYQWSVSILKKYLLFGVIFNGILFWFHFFGNNQLTDYTLSFKYYVLTIYNSILILPPPVRVDERIWWVPKTRFMAMQTTSRLHPLGPPSSSPKRVTWHQHKMCWFSEAKSSSEHKVQ